MAAGILNRGNTEGRKGGTGKDLGVVGGFFRGQLVGVMRGLFGFLILGILTGGSLSGAPGSLDMGRRNETFAPKKNIETGVKSVEEKRILQEKRLALKGAVERKEAAVGEKRANIAVGESREKKLFPAKENLKFGTLPHRDAAVDGKMAGTQTGKLYMRGGKMARQQSSVLAAYRLGGRESPKIEKTVSVEDVNRFVFRKNGDREKDWSMRAGGEKTTGDKLPSAEERAREIRVLGILP